MTRTKSIRQGNQASDELPPGLLVFLWVFIAAQLVVPAIFLVNLVTGNTEVAEEWAMGSIVCVLVALLLFAGLRSSARDTRQLRARGVPGTAAVISVRPEEDGYSAVLRIRVDDLEPFEHARVPHGVR